MNHPMLRTCKRVTAGILWANLHPLFWLSLIPFTTRLDGRKPLHCRRGPGVRVAVAGAGAVSAGGADLAAARP